MNRCNQVQNLTQDSTWESDKTQLNITNENQETKKKQKIDSYLFIYIDNFVLYKYDMF